MWARIEVLDLETYYRAEVLRTGPNTLPRAIVVDPDSRYIQILYIATCTSFLPSLKKTEDSV